MAETWKQVPINQETNKKNELYRHTKKSINLKKGIYTKIHSMDDVK
jgi:hypothetical protein